MTRELLTVEELAKLLRLGRRTIWRRISDQTLPPPIRIGRAVRFRRSTIEDWLQTKEEEIVDDEHHIQRQGSQRQERNT